MAVPLVTVIVTVFSPSSHVALAPFSISVSPTKIVISAFSSSASAVILLLALEVVAVYSVTSPLNSGVKVSEPIVSPDKSALKGFRGLRQWC